MKLLGLRLCEHDSNISFYDGKDLKYYKSERNLKIKHHAYDNLWEWRNVIQNMWGIDHNEIDEIAIVVDSCRHGLPTNNDIFFPAIDFDFLPTKTKVWRINHHYAHALSTWMLHHKKPEISIVIDGFGDGGTKEGEEGISWSVFKESELIETGKLEINGSIGIGMARAGRYLGIQTKHESDIAGKVMGLQAYGKLEKPYLDFLRQFNMYSVGEIFNVEHWFNYKQDYLLGNLQALNWIHTVHVRVGEVLLEFFSKFANTETVISYSGGVAQNVIWNTELKKKFPNLIIPPHSSDEGLSLGAIEWLREKNNVPKFRIENFPYVQSDQNINDELSKEAYEFLAKKLSEGKILAWYQGNGEIGPRALGNRSILFNPLVENGKAIINEVKKRENYRPFGAVVLKEHANEYFDLCDENPYMLYVGKVKSDKIGSITHVDGTCRVQTLGNENLKLRKLIEEFHKITKCPILLNTSLNLAGYPLIGSVDDAIEIFKTTPIDILVVGNKIYQK